MTRLITIFFCSITLASCDLEPNKTEIEVAPMLDLAVDSISHKGHDYLIFHNYEGSRRAVMSVVHDPDCAKCRQQKLTDNEDNTD